MTTNQKVIATLILIIGMLLGAVAVVKGEDSRIDDVKYQIQVAVKQFGDKECSIDGKPVSLGQLMYGLALQEGGYKPGTVGYRTNNRGSLHRSIKITPKSTIVNDGSKRRPVYATVTDGLMDKAHLITSDSYNNCNFQYRHLFNYIIGPNGDPNKIITRGGQQITQGQKVSTLLTRLYNNALKYDNQTIHKSAEMPKELPKPTKICRHVGTIDKDEYLQIDNLRGQFKLRLRDLWIGDKVFICKDL